MHKNFHEINQVLSDVLKKGEPSSVLRVCNTTGYVIQCCVNNQPINREWFDYKHLVEFGITPHSLEYALSVVIKNSFDILKKSDVLGFVDISGGISRDPIFLAHFPNRPIYFDYDIMCPGALLGHSKYGHLENPWTQQLAGKKVLVLSSHAHTIMEQWKNIDAIWGENRKNIAPFELVGVINTPFHPAIDDRQYPDCDNFMKLIEITNKKIDEYDYDVLLTGINTQSPFYCQHAKESGKIGIQLGGTIQLLFGILGKRWVNGPQYNYLNKSYNEHWKYPLKIDEPQKRADIAHLEASYAYWS